MLKVRKLLYFISVTRNMIWINGFAQKNLRPPFTTRPWFEFLEIVQSLDVSSGLVCTTFCLWIISRLTDGQMRLQRTKCLAVETKAQDCLSYQFESERVINWSEKEDVVDLEQTITILSTWQSLKKILEMDD